ncbi:MAG: hypothetical protein ACRDBY_11090 [Cetobacterium sp.]
MEIGRILEDGTIEREFYIQGEIYKNYDNFINGKGTCYVPELYDEEYTREDFLQITNGNERAALFLFEGVDWQSPMTLHEEYIDDDESDYAILVRKGSEKSKEASNNG